MFLILLWSEGKLVSLDSKPARMNFLALMYLESNIGSTIEYYFNIATIRGRGNCSVLNLSEIN